MNVPGAHAPRTAPAAADSLWTRGALGGHRHLPIGGGNHPGRAAARRALNARLLARGRRNLVARSE